MPKCVHDQYWTGIYGACMACRAENAEAKLKEAREEIAIDDSLLEHWAKFKADLLASMGSGECPAHGDCKPHAIEQVKALVAERDRLRKELKDYQDAASVEAFEGDLARKDAVELDRENDRLRADFAEAVEALRGLHRKADGVARNPSNAWQWLDWACAECRPESDVISPGFQCDRHRAAAFVAKHKTDHHAASD